MAQKKSVLKNFSTDSYLFSNDSFEGWWSKDFLRESNVEMFVKDYYLCPLLGVVEVLKEKRDYIVFPVWLESRGLGPLISKLRSESIVSEWLWLSLCDVS